MNADKYNYNVKKKRNHQNQNNLIDTSHDKMIDSMNFHQSRIATGNNNFNVMGVINEFVNHRHFESSEKYSYKDNFEVSTLNNNSHFIVNTGMPRYNESSVREDNTDRYPNSFQNIHSPVFSTSENFSQNSQLILSKKNESVRVFDRHSSGQVYKNDEKVIYDKELNDFLQPRNSKEVISRNSDDCSRISSKFFKYIPNHNSNEDYKSNKYLNIGSDFERSYPKKYLHSDNSRTSLQDQVAPDSYKSFRSRSPSLKRQTQIKSNQFTDERNSNPDGYSRELSRSRHSKLRSHTGNPSRSSKSIRRATRSRSQSRYMHARSPSPSKCFKLRASNPSIHNRSSPLKSFKCRSPSQLKYFRSRSPSPPIIHYRPKSNSSSELKCKKSNSVYSRLGKKVKKSSATKFDETIISKDSNKKWEDNIGTSKYPGEDIDDCTVSRHSKVRTENYTSVNDTNLPNEGDLRLHIFQLKEKKIEKKLKLLEKKREVTDSMMNVINVKKDRRDW